MTIPYANATSGHKARDEITKMLRKFGCESVGFMEDFEKQELLLAFKHRGRSMQLRASARGWAAMYLKENPWNSRRAVGKSSYEQAVLSQGLVAVNSILRDWVKGQIMAVESGILSFDAVFMPYMLTGTGKTLLEFVTDQNLLPGPQ